MANFNQVPVLWEDGTVIQLGLPEGAIPANADDINNHGVIIGQSFFAGIPSPGRDAGFIWRDGQFTVLGSPGGQYMSTAVYDINNRGIVVGQSFDPAPTPTTVATIWQHDGRPAATSTS